jgi:hypothetical protein
MKFDYEKFDKWESENHIPEQVKRIVNAVLVSEGYEEPFPPIDKECVQTTNEETITIRNRGGYICARGKGISLSYCTSSYADGSESDCKYLINFIKGLGFTIENSYGDNGMDSSSNWHDTYWTYDFLYEPSTVYEEEFEIWEDSDYED